MMLSILTGCNDKPEVEPETGPTDRMAVNLQADVEPAATLKVAGDKWEAADRVGLYMKKAGQAITAAGAVYADASNVQMSIASGMLTSTPQLYYPLEGNVDFMAYYPYTAQVDADFTIPVNVAEQAGGLPVEILYSNNATNKAPAATTVPLNFRYSLAKVAVTVTGGVDAALTAAHFAEMTVTVDGLYTQARLQLTNGTFTAQQGYGTIALHKAGSTATSASFDALLLPATVAAGQVTFTFHVGDESYPCKVEGNYAAATHYDLYFTLNIPEPPEPEPDPVATLLSATITPRTVTSRSFTVDVVTGPETGLFTVEATAGQLQQQLNELTENNPAAIKGLTLTGTLNAADFATLNALPALEALNMEGIQCPNSRIPNDAFKNNTRLKMVVLPALVTEIGNNAFYGCSSLIGKLTIPDNVTLIETAAFRECSKLTDLALGTSVKTIGIEAFYGCGAKGILVLPDGLESIGASAFCDCKFTGGLTFPASVKSIGERAFYSCSSFNGTLTLPTNAEFTAIPNSCFSDCGFTGSLVIPNNVITIGSNAFSGGDGFTGDLTIGNGVTNINTAAFQGCTFTGKLTISNSVKIINNGAFSHCDFTGNLVIPNSVTSIGDRAFQGCTGFNGTLTIGNGVKTIESMAFEECNFTGNLVIPNNVTSIGSSRTFARCTGFDGTLTLPVNTEFTTIPMDCFNGCKNLSGTLVIPNNVKSIGSYAFSNCSGFTGNLTIPNSVTSIGQAVFANCTGFNGTLTLPVNASITSIDNSCFSGCKNLSGTLVIPNNVKTIGNSAFYECWSLTGLSLGGVNSIRALGFGYCSALEGTVDVSAFAASVAANAFEGCTKLTVIR